MGIKEPFISILLVSLRERSVGKTWGANNGDPQNERRRPVMGNLIKKQSYSEVTATLERLDRFGITPEHFKEIRSDDATAKVVAEAWHEAMKSRFADEEVKSTFTYPDEYQLQSVKAQIKALLAIPAFKDLDVFWALEHGQAWFDGLQLPEWVEGPLVYVWHERLGGYHALLELVLSAIAESRTFRNFRQGTLGENYLRQSERSRSAEVDMKAHQPGDLIIVPNQAGIRWRGKSNRRARVLYDTDEFGLGAVAEGCRALSHPKRFVRWEQLHVDCGGDEYAPSADGDFCRAPCFGFGGGVEFGTFDVGSASEVYGSASAFLPQQS